MGITLFFTLFIAHRLYRKLWLYNWGKPLSEKKLLKRDQFRRQVRDNRRYDLHNRLYRFADLTELDYQAERAQEAVKKLDH